MNLDAMRWALYKAPLQANAAQARNRLVLTVIAAHALGGRAEITRAMIAAEAQLSTNTVTKATQALEQAGLIVRVPNGWEINMDMVRTNAAVEVQP